MSAGASEFSVNMRLLLEANGFKAGAQQAKAELTGAGAAGERAFEKVGKAVDLTAHSIRYNLTTSITQAKTTAQRLGIEGAQSFTRITQGATAAARATDTVTPAIERSRRSMRGLRDDANATFKTLQDGHRRFTSMLGALGFAGAGYGAMRLLSMSGNLDVGLTQVMQTADASKAQRNALRGELYGLGRGTGRSVEDLLAVQGTLVAQGLSWDQSRASTAATARAMAVTKAAGTPLANSLVTASNIFGYDLAKDGVAAQVLDMMRAADKAGALRMEDLANVLPRVGLSARDAGVDLPGTLSFLETLSKIQPNAEQLATMGDSTLRLFNNKGYRDQVEQISQVRFFAGGKQREVSDVIADLVGFAAKGKDIEEVKNRLGEVFRGMDVDTVRGMAAFVQQPERLAGMRGIRKLVDASGGMIEREQPEATNNLPDQLARLRTAMREAAENFTQPINSTIVRLIKWSQDSKKLSPEATTLMVGGAGLAAFAGLAGVAAVARRSKSMFGKLFGGTASTALGVAQGQALGAAGLATPVFVVNMPAGGLGGRRRGAGGSAGSAIEDVAAGAIAAKILTGRSATWRLLSRTPASMLLGGSLGAGAAATAGAGVAAAGAVGYGAGTLAYNHWLAGGRFADVIGAAIARGFALAGLSEDRDAVSRMERAELTLKIDSEGRPRLAAYRGDLNLNVETGFNIGMVP